MDTVLYLIGFLLVVLYLLFGIDDFIWDIATIFRKRSYKKKLFKIKDLEKTPPKLMALMIGCWHESKVIKSVVENIVINTNYPISMYHIFIGVYPNDPDTINEVKKLEKEFSNVSMIVNTEEGPTSKAQNLNNVIRQIKEYEKVNGIEFAAFTIHDSEDVVHPYEFLVTNYLIDKHDVLQYPVFPIIKYPRLKNFFTDITKNTYADEFAENHYSTLVGRYATGGFVPCAGTGFALSRKTILSFGDEDVMPSNSLTEDYSLSLSLYEKGIQLYYILEKIPRVNSNLQIKYDYVTTRSIFPNSFKAAVKQKTRWIYGITMQTTKFSKIFAKNKNMKMVGRYTLYKDLKAKYGNLIIILGYAVMIYWLFSFFFDLPQVYTKGTLPYYLCFVVTGMTIIRQIYRGKALYHVYGIRSAFFGVFFPPLFPIRLVYGNIINLVSTVRAFNQRYSAGRDEEKSKQKYFKNKNKKREKPRMIKWAHTDHEFLDAKALERYHRNLGDTLLVKEIITPRELKDALECKRERLGDHLLMRNIIREEELLDALAASQNRLFIREEDIKKIASSSVIGNYDTDYLRKIRAVPINSSRSSIIFGISNSTNSNIIQTLRKKYKKNIYTVYVTERSINQLLRKGFSNETKRFEKTTKLYKQNKISSEQFLIVAKYSYLLKKSEEDILSQMGLLFK